MGGSQCTSCEFSLHHAQAHAGDVPLRADDADRDDARWDVMRAAKGMVSDDPEDPVEQGKGVKNPLYHFRITGGFCGVILPDWWVTSKLFGINCLVVGSAIGDRTRTLRLERATC
jgi:hypothetical protein